MSPREDLLRRTYVAFNARDIDAALATMSAEVDWPNAWEGGRVVGHAAVRDYWERQWAAIDPSVEPTAFTSSARWRSRTRPELVASSADGRGRVDLTPTVGENTTRTCHCRVPPTGATVRVSEVTAGAGNGSVVR
jgi:hypothetical protein